MSEKNEQFADAARGNVIDRFIAWRNPEKGLQRLRARMAMATTSSFFGGSGSYSGASRSKSIFKKWFTSNRSANDDLLPDSVTLRSRCRDLDRNNPIAGGTLNKICTSAVGGGLRLQSQIDSRVLGISDTQKSDWQTNVEFEFRRYASSKNCDLARSLNFYELQSLVFHNALLNGDVLTVLPRVSLQGFDWETRIQVIEADRVCNPYGKPDTDKLVGGVHLDEFGAPLGYEVCNVYPHGRMGKTAAWSTVSRFGNKTGRVTAILLFDPKRPNQVRGVPYLSAVIEPLKQLARYTEAELAAAVVSGMFSVFIKTPSGVGGMLGAKEIQGSTDQAREYELGNGAILEGLPGDEITTINPARPNDSFDPFVLAILRQIGIRLELPYEVLIQHFTSSYTAARAAILEAWKLYRRMRGFVATNWCQPIYEAWLWEAVSAGRIAAPGFLTDARIRTAYCGASWLGGGMGVLDPQREASAVRDRLDIGLTTLQEEIAAYDGGDWEEKHRAQVVIMNARRKDGLVVDKTATAPEKKPFDPDDTN